MRIPEERTEEGHCFSPISANPARYTEREIEMATRIARVLVFGVLVVMGIAACKMPGMDIGDGEPSSTPTLTINTVAGDDVVDETEDGNTVTIDGTVTNMAAGIRVTVTLDDADADSDPDITKNSTVNAVGSWSVSVTSQEMRILEAGMVIVTAMTGNVTVSRMITYTPLKQKYVQTVLLMPPIRPVAGGDRTH